MRSGVAPGAHDEPVRPPHAIGRLGVVVHPTRDVDGVLASVRGWAARNDVRIGQVRLPEQLREVAEPIDVTACDLILALGGDGTTLAALHAAASSGCPVLPVSCGSVGVLMSLAGSGVGQALDDVAAGRWTATRVPALRVTTDGGSSAAAVNDVVLVRQGPGQIMVSVAADDVLYARVSGDGLVAATPLGSSAYTMAAGGPILAPGTEGIALTPLAPHGGSCPPLVVASGSRLELEVDPGHSGVRYEIDGRPESLAGRRLTVAWRPGYATLVTLPGEEPRLTGLRRRGLVLDSPRVLVRDTRSHDPHLGSQGGPSDER